MKTNLLRRVVSVSTEVTHTMKGGIGASWQAMGPTGFYYKKDKVNTREGRRARGSGWGANPPVSYTKQWSELKNHWKWLGMSFSRVELDMRMYCPEKGAYSWDNEEMQTLYQILDICEELKVDVFLTQMWQDVKWNAIDGVSPLQSAPKSNEDFAETLCTLMDHLVKQRSYSCIKYLCITNEPAASWGWWLGADGKPMDMMPAYHLVRAGLDKRGIHVPISGPDFMHGDDFDAPHFKWDDPVIESYDFHDYYGPPAETDWLKKPLDIAKARNVPVFISEFGSFEGGDCDLNPMEPACADYKTQLLNADKIISGLNVGVDGFNRWSFTNRGDLDGQWQLVETWDPLFWKFYDTVTPKPIPYFSYGILSRFIPKYSKVLKTIVDNEDLAVVAIQSPKEELSIIVLNRANKPSELQLTLPDKFAGIKINKYQIEERLLTKDFRMDPVKSYWEKAIEDTLPARSITTYSSYVLKSGDFGVHVE